ncbi:hypothetical protein FA13DRAFT_1792646 [Coprinellus micaceus]|uniref:Uncharacterized protein n=1 Tax=Coprinellus micaceus TaxID=71717 RepID=A0A4Y7T861_COPMI|nr:hypothetical protein FA13DRAFT_1792646 [Coprinellus micaceus]
MASLSDVTAVMGEYMLKGWVLTDKQCSTAGCAVPMMRSPRGQRPEVWFCAKCNGAPGAPAQPASQATSPSVSTVTNKSNGFSGSRASTPLTEVEDDEEDEEVFILPPESDESRRRREQSDRASAEIGNRLLRGWAMLGDECPNDSCFGIPLVRPPNNPDGEKDPRNECVVCGNVYMPQSTASTQPQLETPVIPQQEERSPAPVQQSIVQTPLTNPKQIIAAPVFSPAAPAAFGGNAHLVGASGASTALSNTDLALQNTLNALSSRLNALTSSASMDVIAVGSTADAISKVAHALGQVKSMQWSEAQAHGL